MAKIGDILCWNISVTNNGQDDDTGVIVTDILPTGLSFQSATLDGVDTFYNIATGEIVVGDVEVGETKVIKLCSVADAIGTYTNTADVAGTNTDLDTSNNTDDSDSVDVVEPTCDDFIGDKEGLCAYVTANPTSPLALADCDEGGVSNIEECENGGDPYDPEDDVVVASACDCPNGFSFTTLLTAPTGLTGTTSQVTLNGGFYGGTGVLNNVNYDFGDGTSGSAPYVTGIIASTPATNGFYEISYDLSNDEGETKAVSYFINIVSEAIGYSYVRLGSEGSISPNCDSFNTSARLSFDGNDGAYPYSFASGSFYHNGVLIQNLVEGNNNGIVAPVVLGVNTYRAELIDSNGNVAFEEYTLTTTCNP